MFVSFGFSRPSFWVIGALSFVILLSACATNNSNGLPSQSDDLPALPKLEDPLSESMLQRVAREYHQWLANPTGYLNTPTQNQPWPCEVDDKEKNKLAGIPDYEDPKLKAGWTQAQQNIGVKKSKPPLSLENPQVYLLKGSCVAGKLEGDIELLGDYVVVLSNGDNTTRIPKKVLTRVKVASGKPVGGLFRAEISGQQQESKPLFGIIVKSSAAAFQLSEDIDIPYRSVNIRYTRSEVPPSFPFSLRPSVDIYQWVEVNEPIRGDRWRQITYHGPSKAQERLFKGDKLHGKTRQFAYSFISGQGIRVPMQANEFCYDEGELIKSATCDVE